MNSCRLILGDQLSDNIASLQGCDKSKDFVVMAEVMSEATLPDFYWSGETKMNCISQVVNMTAKTAYSHHIQRLMITGNFALLTGLDVKQVHEWYLAVYCDAYEWVELPNTLGMALFADGGLFATKPYAASGAYINRMSNFCKHCAYNVKEKQGENACPFNYLYWNFLYKHCDVLKKNHRMQMILRNLDRLTTEQISAIRHDSKEFLDSM